MNDFAQHWIELWNRADVPALIELFAPHARYKDPNHTDEVVGREAIARVFNGFCHIHPQAKFSITSVNGNLALGWTADLKFLDGWVMGLEGVDVFEFDEHGRITRLQLFYDRVPFLGEPGARMVQALLEQLRG